MTSGLTADCTGLEIGPYDDKKTGKHYDNKLHAIRPAFGGNIVATIINPDHFPQMATVRSGVMQKALYEGKAKGEVVYKDPKDYVDPLSYAVKVIDRHVEARQEQPQGCAYCRSRRIWCRLQRGFRHALPACQGASW